MRDRRSSVLLIVSLAGTLVLNGTSAEVVAQTSQRGYSTRGVNPVGTQRSAARARVTRPMSNRSVLSNRANVNPGGPLSFDYAPRMTGPTVFFDSSMFGASGDMAASADMGMQGNAFSAGSRPSIRPRLDIGDRDAMNSKGVLGRIRSAVLQQIAQCPEQPFSPQWYAAHDSVTPIRTSGGDPWTGSSWTEAQAWLGMDAEPQHYDFRPDSRGLIFVYQDDEQRGRAVDARAGREVSPDRDTSS